MRTYVYTHTEIYVHLWMKRKGYGSLITRIIMWHMNREEGLWESDRTDIPICMWHGLYSCGELVRWRGAYTCIYVCKDICVLMGWEEGAGKSFVRYTHVTSEQKWRACTSYHIDVFINMWHLIYSSRRLVRYTGAYICMYTYMYAYSWIERKGHGSLVAGILMWHNNSEEGAWNTNRIYIFIYMSHLLHSSRRLVR